MNIAKLISASFSVIACASLVAQSPWPLKLEVKGVQLGATYDEVKAKSLSAFGNHIGQLDENEKIGPCYYMPGATIANKKIDSAFFVFIRIPSENNTIRLSSIMFQFPSAEFSHFKTAISEKYNDEGQTIVEKFQTKGGLKFDSREVKWLVDGGEIRLEENSSRIGQACLSFVCTPLQKIAIEAYKAKSKKAASDL